jgi:ABC-type transport system substrate-binding protein
MEMRFVKEASTRLASLLAGEVQLTDLPQDLQTQAVQRGPYRLVEAKSPSNRVWVGFYGVYYKDIKDLSQGYVYPETPMADVRVRKALSKAVDRDQLNKAFFGGKARPMYLNNFTSNWPGWNADWERRFQNEYGYDLTAAKALLTDAGFSSSKPYAITMLVLQLAGLSSGGDIAEAIAGFWRSAGINVELTPMDGTTSGALTRALKFNNHSRIVATGSNIWTGTSTYSSGTKDTRSGGIGIPEADRALAEAQGTLDEKKEDEALRRAGTAWYDGHVEVPLFWLPAGVVVDSTVVADYVFPGNVTGLWSHVENIKAAR